jgi:hypothetical protein
MLLHYRRICGRVPGMTLTTAVAFDKVEPSTPTSPGTVRAVVTVDDSDHPRLSATFSYFASWFDRRDASWALVSLAVGPRADLPIGKHLLLTVTQVRDLPVARWQQAARAAATAEIGEAVEGGFRVLSRELEDIAKAGAGMTAAEVFGAPMTDRRAQRGLESRLRLVRIAREYRENLAAGVTDPAGAIARDRGVNPSTVRSWIRRARRAGFLGPAMGRTPGEQDVGES